MIYSKKCEQCDKEFDSERSDARFCSDSCRKKLSRTEILVKSDTIDIGYGTDDYTRKMVEDRIKSGDTFIPNWFSLPEKFLSKNHYKSLAWKSNVH